MILFLIVDFWIFDYRFEIHSRSTVYYGIRYLNVMQSCGAEVPICPLYSSVNIYVFATLPPKYINDFSSSHGSFPI